MTRDEYVRKATERLRDLPTTGTFVVAGEMDPTYDPPSASLNPAAQRQGADPAGGSQMTANLGHGHVRPRPDGMKAKCGGPAICAECARELATTGQSTAGADRPTEACPFCQIVAGDAPATVIHEWSDALAFTPLNPVTAGHTLVIPKAHVADFAEDPEVSAAAMRRAAEFARWWSIWLPDVQCNVITSKGRAATQSVFHLHLHLVPRRENDGLALPWYSGKTKRRAA